MNSKHLGRGTKSPPPLDKGKVRLYSNRFCPYSQRVILVLDAKKITYETVNINLANKPAWIYDKTPGGKVPAIEFDNGEVLYDSLVIADFIDDKYHHCRLNARDPLQKAKDQLLLKQFNKIINALVKSICTGRVDSDEAAIVTEGLTTFERDLVKRQSQFFGGNKPGMLDYMIWPWCERLEVLKIYGKEYVLKKEKFPHLLEWRKMMIEDEVVQKSYCDTNTHIKFLESFRVGVPDYDLLVNKS